ncbi:periplasmic nitrate reductase, NapE protein [Ensifer sp. IC4062]|nr:periplasmic nitrate reductase, NapE protein [Ensifer sp. IC4062]
MLASASTGDVSVSELSRQQVTAPPSRRREFLTFLVLAFGIWPLLAVAVVGGYGFLVWMFQVVFGPPGPPPAPH